MNGHLLNRLLRKLLHLPGQGGCRGGLGAGATWAVRAGPPATCQCLTHIACIRPRAAARATPGSSSRLRRAPLYVWTGGSLHGTSSRPDASGSNMLPTPGAPKGKLNPSTPCCLHAVPTLCPPPVGTPPAGPPPQSGPRCAAPPRCCGCPARPSRAAGTHPTCVCGWVGGVGCVGGGADVGWLAWYSDAQTQEVAAPQPHC